MQATFYKNTSDNRVVNKSLATLKSDLIIQNQPIDRAKPIFKVTYDESLLISNYCYIDVFERYYYIDTIETQGQMLNVICDKCDVLMSFKKYLNNLDCILKRQEKIYNAYLNDDKQLSYDYSNLQTLEFTGGTISQFPNQSHIILALTGGS